MLANGIDLVVVDNTNPHPWETEPYTDAARAAGYQIVILNFLPREFEKHMASQKVTPEKPDAHEVPEQSMREHIADFLNYNDLLDKSFTPDPTRHFNYHWDGEKQDVVKLPGTAKHFDYNTLITITPKEYHTLKETVGTKFLPPSRRSSPCGRTGLFEEFLLSPDRNQSSFSIPIKR